VLVFMAGLLALVGGMGLAGTMSLNVMERTREIGVLRAVGASNGAVRKIVLSEGVVVGLLGWALSAVISLPFGYLLTQVVSRAMFGAGVVYYIDPTGIWMWAVLVQVIAALSSLAPAQHAARLTVREVLAYE
jgi:putative ABC transport system permease protein